MLGRHGPQECIESSQGHGIPIAHLAPRAPFILCAKGRAPVNLEANGKGMLVEFPHEERVAEVMLGDLLMAGPAGVAASLQTWLEANRQTFSVQPASGEGVPEGSGL